MRAPKFGRSPAGRTENYAQAGPKALGASGESCDAFPMWTDQRGSELLPLAECVRLLAIGAKEGLTGRLGISTPQAPLIQPVNFGVHDGRIVIRLGPGHLGDIISDTLVAFEVDHVDPHAKEAWSVLVRGLATVPEGSERDAIGSSVPTPLVPTPGETILVVRPDVVTGRRFPVNRSEPDSSARSNLQPPVSTSSVTKEGTASTCSDTDSPSAP